MELILDHLEYVDTPVKDLDPDPTVPLTKKGTPRLRRPPMTQQQKKTLARQKIQEKFTKILENGFQSCTKCIYKCTEKIALERRQEILQEYLQLETNELKKIFVLNLCERLETKEGSKRIKNRFRYFLFPGKDSRKKERVCKRFFLATLGYSSLGLFYDLLKKTPNSGIPSRSNRGTNSGGWNRFQHRHLVIAHIDSYHPKYKNGTNNRNGQSVVRIPRRRYLPKLLTIKSMHQDFQEKNPDLKISYNLYQAIMKDQNVVFDKS